MKKLLVIPAVWFLVGAISITYQDIRDARFRRRHGLHPHWRTHEPEPERFIVCDACGGDWNKVFNGRRVLCECCDHGYVTVWNAS